VVSWGSSHLEQRRDGSKMVSAVGYGGSVRWQSLARQCSVYRWSGEGAKEWARHQQASVSMYTSGARSLGGALAPWNVL
jgi:hypothetical protein